MSDISSIFKAYDIRGKVGSELSPELIQKIGQIFANFLPADGPVVVGHDMRPDSRALADKLIEGLILQGRDVWDIGLVTSDIVYFAPGKFGIAGGAMITASHNPGEYNGIKFCREKALPVGLESGLDKIRDDVLANNIPKPSEIPGSVEKKDLRLDWIEHVLSFVDISGFKPFNIAIDAGNGMTGAIVPLLKDKIPLNITEMYFELDGTFPNHEANPMKVETLEDIGKKIVAEKLDFGIAFDGDGDRMALIDEHGVPVSGSMTTALLATHVLAKHPGTTIVHDLRMSRGTIELIESLGGSTVRAKVGNTIIKQATREHDAAFGAEITGHFMFKENYFVDSGLLAALIAIEVLSHADFTLSEFVARHDTYKHVPEINLEVSDKQATLDAIENAFSDGEVDWLDGLFVSYDDAWLNIRPSNTEPVLRFNLEAKTEDRLTEIVEKVKSIAG